VEDDNNKATIESWQVLITATNEKIEISTLDDNGEPKTTIVFDGDKLKMKTDVYDE